MQEQRQSTKKTHSVGPGNLPTRNRTQRRNKNPHKPKQSYASDSELISSYNSSSRLQAEQARTKHRPTDRSSYRPTPSQALNGHYAGPTFHKSPAPSSLPIPAFSSGNNGPSRTMEVGGYVSNAPIPNHQSGLFPPEVVYHEQLYRHSPSMPMLYNQAWLQAGCFPNEAPPLPIPHHVVEKEENEKMKKHCGQVLLSMLGVHRDQSPVVQVSNAPVQKGSHPGEPIYAYSAPQY